MNRIFNTQLKYIQNYSRLINNPKSINDLFVRNKTKKIETSKNIINNQLLNMNDKRQSYIYNHLFVGSESKTSFTTSNQLRTYHKINDKLSKYKTYDDYFGHGLEDALYRFTFVLFICVICFICSFMIYIAIHMIIEIS